MGGAKVFDLDVHRPELPLKIPAPYTGEQLLTGEDPAAVAQEAEEQVVLPRG